MIDAPCICCLEPQLQTTAHLVVAVRLAGHTHTNSFACQDSLPVTRRTSGTTPSSTLRGTRTCSQSRRRRTLSVLAESRERPDSTRGSINLLRMTKRRTRWTVTPLLPSRGTLPRDLQQDEEHVDRGWRNPGSDQTALKIDAVSQSQTSTCVFSLFDSARDTLHRPRCVHRCEQDSHNALILRHMTIITLERRNTWEHVQN